MYAFFLNLTLNCNVHFVCVRILKILFPFHYFPLNFLPLLQLLDLSGYENSSPYQNPYALLDYLLSFIPSSKSSSLFKMVVLVLRNQIRVLLRLQSLCAFSVSSKAATKALRLYSPIQQLKEVLSVKSSTNLHNYYIVDPSPKIYK